MFGSLPCVHHLCFELAVLCHQGDGQGPAVTAVTPHLEMDADLVHWLSPADGSSLGQLPRGGTAD